MPSIDKELASILHPVESRLGKVRARIRDEMRSDVPAVQRIIDHVSRYEGKLLRPGLVLLAGGVFGRDSEVLEQVAAIVEMVHTATLVHDDVLDDAKVRRRVTSVNAEHGNHNAVLLGDYLYARAFHLSTRLNDQACSRVLSDVTRTLCEGEIEELAATFDFEIGREGYFRIIGAKTASLYGAACELGALYAGAEAGDAQRLRNYGYELGMAFQIVDDCLDLSGKEWIVGKSLGTDLDEGKVTLPILELLGALDGGARDGLRDLLRNGTAESRLARLRSEFDLTRAIEVSLAQADRFLQSALENLKPFAPGSCKHSLETMPEYILCREW